MASSKPPQDIQLGRDRDLRGRRKDIVVRRALLFLVALVPLLALTNLFGQRPATASAEGPDAMLSVYAPKRLRSGLLFEARFTIDARRELGDAMLVLDPGWLESMTLNTLEPSPVGESSRDGRLAFDLGHIRAGDSYLLFAQFQVNPTNVGRRAQDVSLYDGKRRLLHVDRTVTVWP